MLLGPHLCTKSLQFMRSVDQVRWTTMRQGSSDIYLSYNTLAYYTWGCWQMYSTLYTGMKHKTIALLSITLTVLCTTIRDKSIVTVTILTQAGKRLEIRIHKSGVASVRCFWGIREGNHREEIEAQWLPRRSSTDVPTGKMNCWHVLFPTSLSSTTESDEPLPHSSQLLILQE